MVNNYFSPVVGLSLGSGLSEYLAEQVCEQVKDNLLLRQASRVPARGGQLHRGHRIGSEGPQGPLSPSLHWSERCLDTVVMCVIDK